MLSALLLAVSIGPGGFINGKHCLGSEFATGDILPVTLLPLDKPPVTLMATTILTLQRNDGEIVGYIYEDPTSHWKIVQSTGAMSEQDTRLAAFPGRVKSTWIHAIPASSFPWKDLTARICVRALPNK